MSVAIEASLSTSTRERVIERIRACEDLQSLFDAANPALGRGRLEWGDSPEDVGMAALFWASCSFPAAARETVWFSKGRIDGVELEGLGLRAAKEIAVALLSALPGSGPGVQERVMGSAADRRAHGRLLDKSAQELRELAVGGDPLRGALLRALAVAKAARRELLEALKLRPGVDPLRPPAQLGSVCGEGPGELLGQMDGEKTFCDPSSYGLSEMAGLARTLEWESESVEVVASPPTVAIVARGLLEDFGLEWVSLGPLSGSMGAESELNSAREALEAAAVGLGAPKPLMGLGRLSLALNAHFEPLGVSAFYSDNCQIAVRRRLCSPSRLAHEWTHALERACLSHGDSPEGKAAQSALTRAAMGIDSTPADQEIAAKVLRVQPERRKIALELERLGDPGEGEQDQEPRESSWAALEAVEGALRGRSLRNLKALAQARERAGAALQREPEMASFQELARRIGARLALQDKLAELLGKGMSVFCSVAKLAEQSSKTRDAHGLATSVSTRNAYWASREEKLARAAEGIFSAGSSDSWDDALIPQGQEREAMSQAILIWVRDSHPLLERLARRESVIGPSASASAVAGFAKPR